MRHLAALLVSVSLASIPASSPPAGQTAGEGRITGRVLTESGLPVDGATVLAILFTDRPRAAGRYAATTGPDGGYVLGRLPPGRFRVVAEKEGYSGIIVQPGQLAGGADLHLEPAGTVSGIDLVLRRTGSIAGRVTRPDGAPVARARVVPQIRMPNGRMLGTGPGVLTDAGGRYELEGVPPGTYVITAIYSVMHEMLGKAVPEEYQDWARTFHPATHEFDRAIPIRIRGGERLEQIDITLQPERRHRISGRVVAEDGSTLRNTRVEYSSEKGVSGVLTHVSDDGQFTIGGVAGSLTLLASANTDKGPVNGLARLNATSSLDDVRLLVGPPARVRGRVTFEGGRPSVESRLEVRLATDWFRHRADGQKPDTAAVGPDGRFSVENVIGERRITVMQLMPQWEVKEIRQGGRVLADGRLTLAAGQVIDDLEIVIARRR